MGEHRSVALIHSSFTAADNNEVSLKLTAAICSFPAPNPLNYVRLQMLGCDREIGGESLHNGVNAQGWFVCVFLTFVHVLRCAPV